MDWIGLDRRFEVLDRPGSVLDRTGSDWIRDPVPWKTPLLTIVSVAGDLLDKGKENKRQAERSSEKTNDECAVRAREQHGGEAFGEFFGEVDSQ